MVKDNLALELPVMKLINNIEHGQNVGAKLSFTDCRPIPVLEVLLKESPKVSVVCGGTRCGLAMLQT